MLERDGFKFSFFQSYYIFFCSDICFVFFALFFSTLIPFVLSFFCFSTFFFLSFYLLSGQCLTIISSWVFLLFKTNSWFISYIFVKHGHHFMCLTNLISPVDIRIDRPRVEGRISLSSVKYKLRHTWLIFWRPSSTLWLNGYSS